MNFDVPPQLSWLHQLQWQGTLSVNLKQNYKFKKIKSENQLRNTSTNVSPCNIYANIKRDEELEKNHFEPCCDEQERADDEIFQEFSSV